jgi:hypothetical protein
MEVVGHLSQDPRPVDRIDGSHVMRIVQIGVRKQRFDDVSISLNVSRGI